MNDTVAEREAATEHRAFEAEVSQLLQLMIHSLYSNPEIFLRELISNASDALDKLRFEAIGNDALMSGDSELHIRIEADEEAGTVTISDNGIGMSREEVIANIGTIAKSGTRQFLESLSGDQKADAAMIGQFGVGFYSAFVVADRVVLDTRRAGADADTATRWSSDGSGGFVLEDIEQAERGTRVTLHLKDEHKEFGSAWRLRSIIKKYSDHVTFPIQMPAPPAPLDEGEDEAEQDATPKWDQVNDASALWTRPKSDISDEDYQNFYQQLSHDFGPALAWTHNRVEGKHEYTSLLYIPENAPFDLYDGSPVQRHGVKLYVQRVFIMDEAEKLMPRYLRFVRGLVDSSDLPLNVSREILQDNRIIDSIRGASIKKVLGLLQDVADNRSDDYRAFWDQFGACLKEGPIEDSANREAVAKLFRYRSTAGDDWVSLDDYIGRMKPGQEKIYYITADSLAAARHSPHLEIFRKKGVEVLLMHDRVDEWTMRHLHEYSGKHFASVAQGELDLGGIAEETPEAEEEKAERERLAEEREPLMKRLKAALEERTSDVRSSARLTDSPACVVFNEQDMPLHLQQLMRQAGHEMPASKPALEVNPAHPLVTRIDNEQDEDRFAEWAALLLDQALLAEGAQLEDGAGFVSRMNRLLLD